MKKFFLNSPLQPDGELKTPIYQVAKDVAGKPQNTRLQMDEAISFPILAAINGYVAPNEDFRVIAVVQSLPPALVSEGKMSNAERNYATLCRELDELCKRKSLRYPEFGVEKISAPANQDISSHITTFQELLNYVDDGDELFACVTYGTKAMPLIILSAIHYACRLKKNNSIRCVVYGEMDWNVTPPSPTIYDVTALVELDELTHKLAELGVSDPRGIIDWALGL